VGPGDGLAVLEAAGTLVTPMFVDLHVHLREPGGEASEDLDSGVRAALAGGYARVFAMPNTSPACDEPGRARATRSRTAAGPVDVVPVSALSRGLAGRELVDLEAMAEAGVGAFSDDGAWLKDRRLAKEAFGWAGRNRMLVAQHCEDFDLRGPGVLHDCDCVRAHGLPGIPRESEDRAVRLDLDLAERTHARFHVCHLSTEGAVAALREARGRGLPVTAEVTPHHLLLTAEDAVRGGADFKVKPPLREAADADALLDALVDGTIAAVATDHAPHAPALKARGLAAAPFGLIGMETAFAALYTGLVLPGRLGLPRLVEALTAGPSAVAGLPAPALVPGRPARLNFLDLEGAWRVEREALRSRSRNCPFHGRVLRGRPVASLVGGTLHATAERTGVRFRTSPRESPPGGAEPRAPTSS
jgi:dihydroorotase